jgi:WD40 repeat protein
MTFKGHKAVINMIIQSKTNGDIISCSEDKTIKIWSITKGECIKSISFTTSINVLHELYNGQILIGTNNTIQVLETSNVIDVNGELSSKLCELGNEGIVAYGNEDGELIVMDVNDKERKEIVKGIKHDDNINSICYNKESNSIFTCSNDSLICVWKLE